jgi:hypothetical protein
MNIYSNVRKFSNDLDIYSNVYYIIAPIYYPDIVILNFVFSINKNIQLQLIR